MISLHQEEKIIAVIRRHHIWLVAKIFSFAVLLVSPIILYQFLSVLEKSLSFKIVYLNELYFFIVSVFYFVTWVYFFIDFLDYWLDVWVITNKKMVIIDQKGLFHRDISEVPIDKIQDIKTSTEGFLQTTVNFGSVSVQTASEEASFKFDSIPDPEKIKDILLKVMHK